MLSFGKRSKKCLSTCHPDLQLIFNTYIEVATTDFGVHEGGRTKEKQLEYYLGGKSKLDPRNPQHLERAMHLKKPSMAADLHVSENHLGESLAWDAVHLSHVVGGLMATAALLYQAGAISHLLRSGGDWDLDGIIMEDQSFDDLPHVELYKP